MENVEHKARRHVGRWIVFGAIGGGLLLAVVAYISINQVAERRWEDMRRRLEERIAEAKSRDSSRPVLRGESVPGNAWNEYSEATMAFGWAVEGFSTQKNIIFWKPGVEPEGVVKIVSDAGKAIDILRRGTHRAEFKCLQSFSWDNKRRIMFDLSEEWRLGAIAACKGRILHLEGRAREAADLLLDVCQYARDVTCGSAFHDARAGLKVYQVSLRELGSVIVSGKLASEDCGEVRREMEILDSYFPSYGLAIKREIPLVLIDLDLTSFDPARTAFGLGESLRYGFSIRLMVAEAAELADDWMLRGAATDVLPWQDARSTLNRIRLELAATKNPIVRAVNPGTYTFSLAVSARSVLARIRILRVAAQYLANGELLKLDDPLGKTLLSSQAGNRLKIWSVGENGVDDGGAGKWDDDEPADIVMECER